MNKKLTIFDDNGGKNILKNDSASIKGTDIILKSLDSGKVLFRGSNKVIVSGSEFNAIKDFDYDKFVGDDSYDFLPSIPSYDMAFEKNGKPFMTNTSVKMPISLAQFKTQGFSFYTGEDGTDSMLSAFKNLQIENEPAHRLYRQFARRVCLWCVGIDGCGIEASRVFKVHNTKWIAPYGYYDYNDGTGGNNTYAQDNIQDSTCLIPFKYRTMDADLQNSYRKQYFGRAHINNTAIGYFFKTFDESPKLIRRYADDSTDLVNVTGDNIDVWSDKRASEAEVVVQLKMSVTASDCREYFNRNIGTNDSKINTISLCTAVPYINPDGILEYADIRPFTRFNFPNEALIDYSKGIDITYYLYY